MPNRYNDGAVAGGGARSDYNNNDGMTTDGMTFLGDLEQSVNSDQMEDLFDTATTNPTPTIASSFRPSQRRQRNSNDNNNRKAKGCSPKAKALLVAIGLVVLAGVAVILWLMFGNTFNTPLRVSKSDPKSDPPPCCSDTFESPDFLGNKVCYKNSSGENVCCIVCEQNISGNNNNDNNHNSNLPPKGAVPMPTKAQPSAAPSTLPCCDGTFKQAVLGRKICINSDGSCCLVCESSIGTTQAPSSAPTSSPTAKITAQPSASPTSTAPTSSPTARPSASPTHSPTANTKTGQPSAAPTDKPTTAPTAALTKAPTAATTPKPTAGPGSTSSTTTQAAAAVNNSNGRRLRV